MKRADVKAAVDGAGFGSLKINDIEIPECAGFRIFSSPDKAVVVQIDINATSVEFEGTAAQILLRQLHADDASRPHEVEDFREGSYRFCRICRQIEGNPKWNPDVCPGPMPQK